jgi:hypothetical protein
VVEGELGGVSTTVCSGWRSTGKWTGGNLRKANIPVVRLLFRGASLPVIFRSLSILFLRFENCLSPCSQLNSQEIL